MTTTETQRNFTLEAAARDAEERYRRAHPASEAAYARALDVMPGGNTRTVLYYSPFPLAFAHGEGGTLTDVDGRRYVDFVGEFTAGLYGHSNPVIVAAVERALRNGFALGGPSRLEADFAAAVHARFPSLARVRFCNSGTEANLIALGAARAWTGRDEIIFLEGAYHGGVLTFGATNAINAPFAHRRIRLNDVDGAREAIRAAGERLAAVMIEPMMGAAGCFPASRAFATALAEEARAQGALLIVDEVMTSRLAPGGLHRALGLAPDLVTLGKYVGGGLSFGAVGGREEIMERFDPRRSDAWGHAGTFNNNVATMAAGLAGLTEVLTDRALEELNARGDRLRARLNETAGGLGAPMIATGIGSIMAYHFTPGPAKTPHDLAPAPAALKTLMQLGLIERGFYTTRRGLLALSLPITDAEIDAFVAAFEETLAEHLPVIRSSVDAT